MKITGNPDLPAVISAKVLSFTPDSDLLQKPISRKHANRKSRNPGVSGGGVRLKREGVPAAGKRGSRPETPLLRWKFDEGKEEEKGVEVDGEKLLDVGRKNGRKVRGGRDVAGVSARKLAAGLWRLQLPEVRVSAGGEPCSVSKINGFGFQTFENHSGIHSPALPNRKSLDSQAKEVPQSPNSVSGSRNKFLHKLEPMFHFSNSAMEGATKWDPGSWKVSEDVKRIYGHSKHLEEQVGVVSMMTALELELEQAQAQIHELEAERRSSKKKLEQFLKKLNEERTLWRSREHEKVRVVIDDLKGELNRERKNRKRTEIVNSKLVSELGDAKLSAKRCMQEYEKERKARELIEEVCDELAKEIGEDKAEVEALKRESMKMREEVDDERKMLQMAEVWREERVQMKLVDAKVTLEEKYTQMNKIVSDLEDFLNSKGVVLDGDETRRVETLRESAAAVNVREIGEFHYEPPNPDDIFSVFEDVNFREMSVKETEPSSKVQIVNPEINSFRHSTAYFDQNGEDDDDDDDDDDDESGWETASHLEDQGSSYSPNGSDMSFTNNRLDSSMSGSRREWEDITPVTEISEVCSVQSKQPKKPSSISRLWRSSYSSNGETCKIISVEGMNGRVSNPSPEHGSGKSGVSPSEQWSSPDSGNQHMNRGMKGCIEWPRGVMQKHSLKAKLLEARMESQKIQLRQVLKQKI